MLAELICSLFLLRIQLVVRNQQQINATSKFASNCQTRTDKARLDDQKHRKLKMNFQSEDTRNSTWW